MAQLNQEPLPREPPIQQQANNVGHTTNEEQQKELSAMLREETEKNRQQQAEIESLNKKIAKKGASVPIVNDESSDE